MSVLIENFPDNLLEALKITEISPLVKSYPNFSNILICGMGGSGIGGKLVVNWFADTLNIPVICCQEYSLPNFVNNKTLVIASSYSGNTEETISALEQAHQKGAYIIGLTSGGKLLEFCRKFAYECLTIKGGNPPRTQLGFSVVLITHVLAELGLVKKEALQDFQTSSGFLKAKRSEIEQAARNLAEFIADKELIIYSDAKDEAIAIRARQQFNENSKILCSHHVIPEMNHNELVGWAGGKKNHAVLFLHTGDVHPQNSKRFAFSRSVIESKTQHIYELEVNSGNSIERSLYLLNIIDWASYYLADMLEVDAVEIEVLDRLKSSLV